MSVSPYLLFLSFFLLSSFPFPSSSSSASDWDIDFWCNSTPHPGTCRHYLPRSTASLKNTSCFYDLSLRLALNLSVHASGHLRRLGPHCRGAPERKAWADCWKLYANTILQLNRTLHPPSGTCSHLDSQTWLSAALTNLDTCLKGFKDLNASARVIQPVLRYNVSDLISNCLAINNATAPSDATHATHDAEAPSWTSVANRRLLQLRLRPDLVVAQDGSGNFRTIQAALDAAATQMQSGKDARFVIYIKAGVYNENLKVASSMNNLAMVGDGIGKTIITSNLGVQGGNTILNSATVSVWGDGFIASGITFRNTFGTASQAVALLSGSDRSVFYQCSIEGFQDTLYVYSQRQFYKECDIYGTIDFIFGNAVVVFQNCTIFLRRPVLGQSNVITAQGRTDPNQNTGIVIQFSSVRAAPDLLPVHRTVRSYLGRPWQLYSRTLYLESYISSVIDPAGWLEFNGNFALDTLFYAEFRNTGPGSRMSRRVRWPGYHVNVRPSLVRQFTVGQFIAGGAWIPATGVPFISGL